MANTKHLQLWLWFFLSCSAHADVQAQTPTANPSLPTISVKNFGATGDGTTDDTAAINAAINACTSAVFPFNGCKLYFPPGIYITTGLSLQSYVHLTGDGWATSVIKLKPRTTADVVTIPAGTFNISIIGITIDGNSSNRGEGHCLTVAATPVSPGPHNMANKQTAPVSAFKFASIEQDMFSNCARDGMHIEAFNYALFVDNIYVFNSGTYGIYDAGTDSIFSNFAIERSGTAGLYVPGANNKYTSGKVIWNGTRVSTEAAVSVSGARNTFTSVEAQDNYTNGFVDTGIDNQFSACLSDANGYARANTNTSSRAASGFIIAGSGGVYIGDKVTSYRGRLPDGNYPTQWPYTLKNSTQSRIDITYDSTNQPPPTTSTIPQVSAPLANHGACIKSVGPPPVIGYCSTALEASGTCTCN
jgi:Pectate lyase superfamily protein